MCCVNGLVIKRAVSLLVSLALLSACSSAPQTSEPAVTQATPTAEASPAKPPPPPAPPRDLDNMRLSVAGVGDIMIGTDYPRNILPDDDGVSFLQHVTPVLSSVDVAFGNYEGSLLTGGEAYKECKNPNACYLFRSPPRYAQHLKTAGFDVISVANNHAHDFGEEGRTATKAALEAVGIHQSGRWGDYASWEQNDLRIGMLAFSPTRGAWNLLDIDMAAWAVAGMAEKHDIVIVSFHGGAEGFDGAERIGFGMEYAYGEKRGDVVAFSRAVIDAGADLVFGHGPHVPRAMELYNDRLIAYSLGNFATYFGISVAGAKGYAPIVEVMLDGHGRFLSGQIHSNIQIRPGGPQPDSRHRAAQMMRELSLLDFPQGTLVIGADGALSTQP